MQGLRSNSAHFWVLEKARVRPPRAWRWGPPRMQALRRISAHIWAPEKAGVRKPILILSPRLALGTLENAGVA